MEIEANTIAEAWEHSIIALLDDPYPPLFTQRGERAKEIIGLQMIVTNPLSEPIVPNTYPFGEQFIENYCENILYPSHGTHSVNSRIIQLKQLDTKSVDQVQGVIELLQKENTSRRAIICLWDAESDITAQHPPCACIIQFLIRNERLETIAYFRSNDSWMAALPDMIAITKISDLIANKLKIKIGRYIHFAASYHLYEPDIVPAHVALGR